MKVADDPVLAEAYAVASGKSKYKRIEPAVALSQFWSYLPDHKYLYIPTRQLWPASAVDGAIPKSKWPTFGAMDDNPKPIRPTAWLDEHRQLQQLVWMPGSPETIDDRLLQSAGWVDHAGARAFNLYRPPAKIAKREPGAPLPQPWLDHVRFIYPQDADHLIAWMAHRVQRPGEKVNHGLVLGGTPGIGKDTMLEPLIRAVGPWNVEEVSAEAVLGRFNGWCKAVLVRVSEARDLGDEDRFKFYERSKVYLAAPPDYLRVDEKHMREIQVANVCGVVITTNHQADGLYLPADDRRHYVTWSPRSVADFDLLGFGNAAGYFSRLYGWYASGGIEHVARYLAELDISEFDAKAPPTKTPAFWVVVSSGESPESGELRDLLELLGDPDATTLEVLVDRARAERMHDLAADLGDRKNRRSVPHKLERVGYTVVRNDDSKDGLFSVEGRRQVIYARSKLSRPDAIRAARRLA